MDVSVVTNSTLQSLPSNDVATHINVPDVKDIEEFKRMMAASQPVPEANLVNGIQQQQELYANTIAKINSVADTNLMHGTKVDSATNLLNTQYALFNLSFNLDLTAKVAGQFSQAVNKLTTMQ
ncbi:EscI/YscI/HrpB family type III secretion system inner rod protein [Salmonella enterica]|uniref:EscI/YscI/HrpB family type III secretion system inner rod protein n=6 Tax=Salmonella enterica TaxID=28901 RepID=A0A3U6Z2Y6_SALDZ|nr:type III secretion system inner rod subunit SctI [Salmonella enterica]EAA4707831.1 EscI/YscI/HrpB family type III secretion system inner rod protein [Salmonella enterica subsp. diarizonae]EAW1959861.1 EscI/YscI/HrpB family type III secretion system inner rod protein [Salmonella enterica subsp. enterica]EBE3717857.1 EscI/YscI/HrpB family type III secretion system inner rod protein [Salmonella enterica subsp. diarizonae serovar 42:l,v:1,5,7]EBH8064431.1 EscI/YscI/HrpB family type III secretion